jgi:uncharacterized phage-associated protein
MDVRKARAAAAYILHKDEGAMEVLWLVKILYAAERKALLGWERPIIGDVLCSLPKGPVASNTYNLMCGKGSPVAVAFWNEEFEPRYGNSIARRSPSIPPDVGPLSRRELGALDEAYNELRSLSPGQLIDKMHRDFPEWKDPGRHSLPIPYEELLRQSGRTPEEISEIVEEIESVQVARSRLGPKM